MSSRREAIKKAWRARKRVGAPKKCAFCHRGIWARGAKHGGRYYHRSCYRRMKVAQLRRQTATRGFYKR